MKRGREFLWTLQVCGSWLKISGKTLRKLAYHDPCELGRGCGIYEQPRSAVSAVGTLVEAEKNREESICCGGSLGSLSLSYEKRKDITLASLRNLTVADPDTIVTACPLCQTTYGNYSDIPVRDIAQLIDDASK